MVPLGNYIQCSNTFATSDGLDTVNEVFIQNANISGLLNYISGKISYPGSQGNETQYDLPTTSTLPTFMGFIRDTSIHPFNATLYFNVNGSGASGVVVGAGQMLATLTMITRTYTDQSQIAGSGGQGVGYSTGPPITWNIYSNNAVVLPNSGCDVSSNSMTIALPDYPGTAAIPLSVHCAQNLNVSYYLTGTTTDSANSIFNNVASTPAAAGIGVQLSNRNGVISTNSNISLGSVGTSPVDLGLTASYARTNGQVVAGNVQSLIGVMFIYQ